MSHLSHFRQQPGGTLHPAQRSQLDQVHQVPFLFSTLPQVTLLLNLTA